MRFVAEAGLYPVELDRGFFNLTLGLLMIYESRGFLVYSLIICSSFNYWALLLSVAKTFLNYELLFSLASFTNLELILPPLSLIMVLGITLSLVLILTGGFPLLMRVALLSSLSFF